MSRETPGRSWEKLSNNWSVPSFPEENMYLQRKTEKDNHPTRAGCCLRYFMSLTDAWQERVSNEESLTRGSLSCLW